MSNYHVTNKKASKDWRVVKEGANRASAIAKTQAQAEKIAKELSGNNGGGEVVIHKPNGGPIRDKDTVFPGKDPCPPVDKKY
ncbi:DUF2188 domain-containing protein [Candidatus Uhrbacteria bacterium]|nr:DUF2188 domain-containing protein [Candidatus Uhrbacteria bacterium]